MVAIPSEMLVLAPARERISAIDIRSTREAGALRDLGQRLLSGTLGHLMLIVFVEAVLPDSHGLSAAVVLPVFAVLCTIRLTAHHAAAHELWTPRRRWALVAVASVGSNLAWGALLAMVELRTGPGMATIVLGFMSCGIAMASVVALAPSPWIQRMALAALILPGAIAGLAGYGVMGFAVLHVMFLAYTVLYGKIASRDYATTVATTELLRDHADAQRSAAVAAAAMNQQLRIEIDQRLKMEVELRQAQKLEAIGRLAAGIAHEINTPVQFITDGCTFLAEGIEDQAAGLDSYRALLGELAAGRVTGADALTRAAQIDVDRDLAYLRENLATAAARSIEGLERVAKIVSATKEFAFRRTQTKAALNVNTALESTLIICRAETSVVADVTTELGELPLVMCHGGEVNQVFLNIIINAAHAIGDVVARTGVRGQIRITTWAPSADSVKISIADTGCGIPNEILDKIFDPFFTTKPVGKGTGQGLAIARSIVVDKHGGTLDVSTTPGAGTTFTVGLPV